MSLNFVDVFFFKKIDNQVLGSSSKNGPFNWLLEKALASNYGSYSSLALLDTPTILSDFINSPIEM